MQGNKTTQRTKGLPPVVYMLIVLTVIFSATNPNYLTLMNFKNVLIQVAPLTIVILGQTCIVLTQGTDLSLGAQVNFIIVFTVWMALQGVPLPAVMLLAILLTTLIEVVSGVIAAKGSIPPFIATCRMQDILNSFSLLLTVGSSTYFRSFIYRIITETTILGVPFMVRATVLIFVMIWVVLNKTKSGTNIHGLDDNREVLQLAGINPVICLIKTYAFAGFIAGIAGVITPSRIEVGMPAVTTGWEFQAVVVALLGGVSLREGKGGVAGTVFDVLLAQVIKNGLSIVGVQPTKQNAIIDSIVLMAIIIDAVIRTRSKE